jgi:hypothetical protein
MSEHTTEFAEDILRGAEEVALFLYGSRDLRRRVYHLAASSKLPVFKLGSMICARKSKLIEWVESQEQRHANDNDRQPPKAGASGNV